MATSRWDSPWERFPASKPLKAEGGIATSKQRGAMADTWWSKRFITVLDSYGLGTRMQRGRNYARSGQVLSLDVDPGLITAQVHGSRRTPYVVTVQAAQPSDVQWLKLDDAFRSRVGFVARLLAGELPPDLEGAFDDAGVRLFPSAWRELKAKCSCPDSENPCKHIAAVLYVFADQLDDDPWLLLTWRGRSREQILGRIRPADNTESVRAGLPPWWPLTPDQSTAADGRRSLPEATLPGTMLPEATPAEPPHRILARLESLTADVGGPALVDLLVPAYRNLNAVSTVQSPTTQ